MPTVSESTLRDMLVGIYSAKGASAEEAETVARHQSGQSGRTRFPRDQSMTTESDPAFVSKPPPDGYRYAGAWIRLGRSDSRGLLLFAVVIASPFVGLAASCLAATFSRWII